MASRWARTAPSLALPVTLAGISLTVLAQTQSRGALIAGFLGVALIAAVIVAVIAKPPQTPQPVDWRVAATFAGATFFVAAGLWLGLGTNSDLPSWIGAVAWPVITVGWAYYAVRRRRQARQMTAADDSSVAVSSDVRRGSSG